MKVLLVINSDFGIKNTIGARLVPIAKAIKKGGVQIYCRGFNPTYAQEFPLRKVVPLGRFIMKALTAVRVYTTNRVSNITNLMKSSLFDLFLARKIGQQQLKDVAVLHSWDPLPRTYRLLKQRKPEIKIYQDIPVALPNIIKKVAAEKIWKRASTELPNSMKEAFRYVDLFVAPSPFVRESLLAEGIPAKRVAVVPFGVDSREFTPRKKGKERIFRVAFAGNISHRKGIKYLLQAWDELQLKEGELHLYGRVFPEVLNLLTKAKERKIIIHGFCDITKELPKNDVYVFPTLMEGSSKSIYEALACGLPVITTYNAGSVVEDGKQGFIIPIQDAKALKERILLLYKRRDRLQRMGAAARRLAKKYTWERYGRDVTRLYQRRK